MIQPLVTRPEGTRSKGADRMARWRAANPERRKTVKQTWERANPQKRWRYKLKWKYGITMQEYERRLEVQNGLYAICGNPPAEDRRLDVDHDHQTGCVRGLVCNQCDRMMGHANDDPARLRAAAAYLDATGGTDASSASS